MRAALNLAAQHRVKTFCSVHQNIKGDKKRKKRMKTDKTERAFNCLDQAMCMLRLAHRNESCLVRNPFTQHVNWSAG